MRYRSISSAVLLALVLAVSGSSMPPHSTERNEAPPDDVTALPGELEDDETLQGMMLNAMFAGSERFAEGGPGRPAIILALTPSGRFVLDTPVPVKRRRAASWPAPLIDNSQYLVGTWRVRDGQLLLGDVKPATRDELTHDWQIGGLTPPSDPVVTLPIRVSGKRPIVQLGEKQLVYQPRTGGIMLRSLDQFREFLTHSPLRRSMPDDRSLAVMWSFNADGTFRAWVSDAPADAKRLHDWWPEDATALRGRWQLSHDSPEEIEEIDLMFSLNTSPSTLQLDEVTAVLRGRNDTHTIGEITIDTEWGDGKLHVKLDGEAYIRRPSPSVRQRRGEN